MNKEYRYRKHIKIFRNICTYINIIVAIIILLGFSIIGLILKEDGLFMIILGIIISIILVFEALLIRQVYGRFLKISVSLSNEGILYKNHKGETYIKYEEINKIEFPSIKYTGGWIKITASKKTIRLTVVIEKIDEFLYDLKLELDNRGLRDTYDNKRFFSFYKTAAFSDQSWDRIYKIFKEYLLSTVLLTIISIGISIIVKSNIAFVIFSFLYPTIIYVFTEIIFGKKLSKSVDHDTFSILKLDDDYLNSVYKKSVFIGIIVYIILFSLFLLLNIFY